MGRRLGSCTKRRDIVPCRICDSITLPCTCNVSDLQLIFISRRATISVADCLRALLYQNFRVLDTFHWHLRNPKVVVTHRVFIITHFLLKEL